jgi:hypothetical protein
MSTRRPCDFEAVDVKSTATSNAAAPLDCAGGFKAEALGISLFDRIDPPTPPGLLVCP